MQHPEPLLMFSSLILNWMNATFFHTQLPSHTDAFNNNKNLNPISEVFSQTEKWNNAQQYLHFMFSALCTAGLRSTWNFVNSLPEGNLTVAIWGDKEEFLFLLQGRLPFWRYPQVTCLVKLQLWRLTAKSCRQGLTAGLQNRHSVRTSSRRQSNVTGSVRYE